MNLSSQETSFKEWRQVVQEIVRFVNVDKPFPNARPLRYCAMFDTHPDSLPYVARFHAKKVLKLKDAVLTSYHRNEVNALPGLTLMATFGGLVELLG